MTPPPSGIDIAAARAGTKRTRSSGKVWPLAEQFDVHTGPADANGCTPWMGCKNHREGSKHGVYGSAFSNGKQVLAHRAAWELARGPIPPKMTIDHLCRNTLCVNVEHMEVVTNGENARRSNAAVKACPSGHEYTPENTHVGSDRKRKCRACARARARAKRVRIAVLRAAGKVEP